MKNFGQMMQKVQEMQEKMQSMQEQLEELVVEGSSGAGMVTVALNGKGDMRSISIDPTMINPEEVEILEDLVVAAVNDARAKIELKVSEKMREVSGGLSLPPGFKLPF
ncbi:MAG: YbaB/EbfC family nucleoid-associated protein [Rhodospirillaceae bacterium]|mgnify:CR=1 FL=1|nr:YbaB/EbfC family nucleoid-associated protein [Rhodospirillaceae bacterium]|tara:strand:- start:2002 stop:2325 length:324 start_codon:yes stop_codon:yes gene_type:complete